jgi:tRNA (adenine57-N1/adenine58-N1)-methyltransferase
LTWNLTSTHTQEGDLIELVGLNHKHYIFTLKEGRKLQTHRGFLEHNDLIGLPWGSQVETHLGNPYYLLQPALADILQDLPRATQILYPKDIGFILISMGIGPGMHVLEAGTGSGALTSAFAYAVSRNGKITSYERKAEAQNTAIKNLKRLGLADWVDFKVRDIEEGFDETNVDALFLDLPNPHEYMHHVRKALKPGGFFGCIMPTTNQVSRLISSLRAYQFVFIEVCEIMLRYYRAEPDRLRPADRMIGHTGFLIFARSSYGSQNSPEEETYHQ